MLIGGVQVGWGVVGLEMGRWVFSYWGKTPVVTFCNFFLKTVTKGAVTTEAGSLFQYFTQYNSHRKCRQVLQQMNYAFTRGVGSWADWVFLSATRGLQWLPVTQPSHPRPTLHERPQKRQKQSLWRDFQAKYNPSPTHRPKHVHIAVPLGYVEKTVPTEALQKTFATPESGIRQLI